MIDPTSPAFLIGLAIVLFAVGMLMLEWRKS